MALEINDDIFEERVKKLYDRWRKDTVAYVEECIGVGRIKGGKVGGRKISNLQIKALREIDNIILYKDYKYRIEIKGEQIEIPEELLKYKDKLGLEIDSAKGLGKTAMFAWITLKWVHLYPHVMKGILTAPKQSLLRDNLFGDINKWVNHSKKVWGDDSLLFNAITVMADKVENTYYAGDTFAVGRTSSRSASSADKKATLQGYHAPYLLIIVDECYGLDDDVYDPLTSTITPMDSHAIIILGGNPSKNYGYVNNCKYRNAQYWVHLRFSAEDSDLVDAGYVESKREEYRDNENLFRINVLGLSPIAEANGLIPYDKIQMAVDRKLITESDDAIIITCDIGGGGDTSDLIVMKGNKMLCLERNGSNDTMVVVRWIERFIDEYEPDEIGIDGINLGRGVYDRLRELGYKVTFVDMRATSSDKTKYKNFRAELYGKLSRDFIEDRLDIFDDDKLVEELSSIRKKEGDDVRVLQIVSKKTMKSDGFESPNTADCLAMWKAFRQRVIRENKQYSSDKYRRVREEYEQSWMAS